MTNQELFEEVIDHTERMDDREAGFVESVENLLDKGWVLTEGQESWLSDIYDKYCT